jgi:hypothetical protein
MWYRYFLLLILKTDCGIAAREIVVPSMSAEIGVSGIPGTALNRTVIAARARARTQAEVRVSACVLGR